jgi:anti-sigma B factor antagonist
MQNRSALSAIAQKSLCDGNFVLTGLTDPYPELAKGINMELRQETHGDTVVMRCDGTRLDALVALKFKDGFRDLAETEVERVVLDMADVEFMDSSGLGAVVAVYKLLGSERRFDLAGLSDAVDRVFKLTRMDSIFTIFPTAEAALADGAAASSAA